MFWVKYAYRKNGSTYRKETILEAKDKLELEEILLRGAIDEGIEDVQIEHCERVILPERIPSKVYPRYKKTLLSYIFYFDELPVTFILKRISKSSDKISCFLTVEVDDANAKANVIFQGNFNFYSDKATNDLIKKFNELYQINFNDTLSWEKIITDWKSFAIDVLTIGEPLEELSEEDANIQFLLEPFIVKDLPNLIFGTGGSGKTLFALLLCVSLNFENVAKSIGLKHNKDKCKILFLDYENSKSFISSRLKLLANGYSLKWSDISDFITYRYCGSDLVSDSENILELIDSEKFDLIVIDPLIGALGDSLDPSKVANFFNILRTLKVTPLLISHLPKNTDVKHALPFGSVYITNLVRNMWLINKRNIDSDEFVLTLIHRKTNIDRLRKPLAFIFKFKNSGVIAEPAEITDAVEMGLSLPDFILEFLKSGAKSTAEIAEAYGFKQDSVRVALNRLKNQNKVVRLTDKGETLWGLALDPF